MAFRFPQPLYPIADVAPGRDGVALATAILAGGAKLLQLRAKELAPRELIAVARAVRARTRTAGALLLINDRADVAQLVGADGVHLGQDDLSPAAARAILGPNKVIGFSTHSAAQMDAAIRNGGVDYVAFGPIFATASKRNPDPVQGLDALRAVRARCPLPLVGIGGITGSSAGDVLAAGADAVAVIGAISGSADAAVATRALLAATARRFQPRN
jgi:thiamine-phosphate pyrophosphorylase